MTRGTEALDPHDEPHSSNTHTDTAMRRSSTENLILQSQSEDSTHLSLTEHSYRKGKH